MNRGKTLKIRISWVTTSRLPVEGYIAYLRFDTDFPKSALYVKELGKMYRKVLEKMKGKRFRFRYDFQPLGGIYPPYTWPTGQIIFTDVTVPIPNDIKPGTYRVSLKLSKITQFPNYRLSDIFSNTDMYSGNKIGMIEIE